ncbi:MAG: SpoIID/LytB domain-containing protein [Acidobacteria bacterium]|nr:SpoIID/LytB domain-containing protein [Acidobacteriota bacterium]
MKIFHKRHHIRSVPAGSSFRIWLGSPGKNSGKQPGWIVQVGAYRRHSSVEMCRKMLARFTDEKVSVEYVRKRNLYLVRFGPYSSLSEASATKDLLKMNGFSDVYISSFDGHVKKKHMLYLITEEYDKYPLHDGSVTLKSKHPVTIEGKRYRGKLQIRVNGDSFNVINIVDIEQYLRGVVPAEMGGTLYPQIEALKAQAVAARTYVYYNLGQFKSLGFDICASQSCQVYKGMNAEQDRTDRAVEATRGEIITYKGKPINALFTAFCGGETENVENVFEGGPVPYLKSVKCGGSAGDWISQTLTAAITLEPLESSYIKTPPLAVVRMYETGLLKREELGHLNEIATLTFCKNFFGSVLSKYGIPIPKTGLKSASLKDIAEYLGMALLNTDDTSDLLSSGLLRQPCPDIPAHVIDIVAIAETIREVLNQEDLPKLKFKVVDKDFLDQNPAPDFLFYAAGGQLIPASIARIRFGDRIRYREKPDGTGIAVVEILTRESQGTLNDSFVSSYRWFRFLPADQLSTQVNRYVKVGQLTDISVAKTTATGRVAALKVIGTAGSGIIRGLKIRWALGGKENKFKLFKRVSPDGKLLGVYLSGSAWGHGVGMCQVGAFGMATKGYTYIDILKHYYTGVEIEQIKE